MRREWYRPMTEEELELETSRQELQYLFFWFRTRCGDMEELCSKLTSRFIERRSRNLAAQKVGGRITDITRHVEKLKAEWTRFLKLKKDVEKKNEEIWKEQGQ